jgi:hypothetical protein
LTTAITVGSDEDHPRQDHAVRATATLAGMTLRDDVKGLQVLRLGTGLDCGPQAQGSRPTPSTALDVAPGMKPHSYPGPRGAG